MASLKKEFSEKKMFKFFSDYEATVVEGEDSVSATFYQGSVFPIKSVGMFAVVIEIGGKYKFVIPKAIGVIGTPKVIFSE